MSAPGPLPSATAPDWVRLCQDRWQGRRYFSVLDTGGGRQGNPGSLGSLGLGGFLSLWQAWRHDPKRCEHLHVLLLFNTAAEAESALAACSAHAGALDAALVTELRAAWPPLTPHLHPLHLDAGRVHLLLGLGPLPTLLPRLRLQADVLGLAGATTPVSAPDSAQGSPQGAAQRPAHRLQTLKALARLAAPQALACGAASSPALLAELRTAGFQQADSAPAGQVWAHPQPHARQRLPQAETDAAPRWRPARAAPAAGEPRSPPRSALVIGAGVAGAAAAQALARLGLSVTVLDRQAQPAAETSGNPAALFHGTVNPDDGLYARLFRAAALVAQRCHAAACTSPANPAPVGGQVQGLLRLQPTEGDTESQVLQRMHSSVQRLGLPPAYVQALDSKAASKRAGRPLGMPAWFYPGGGWIDPAAWVRQVLNGPGVCFRGELAVQAIRPQQGQWQALDAQGALLAQADVLVLACAAQCQHLLRDSIPALHWPLRQTRGQVTQLQTGDATRPATPENHGLRLPVAGDGYALPLAAPGAVLCGATRQPASHQDRPGPFVLQENTSTRDDADDSLPRAADHGLNLQRLHRLTGLLPWPGSALQGRVGWRLHSDDRLPIAGPVPLDAVAGGFGAGAAGEPAAAVGGAAEAAAPVGRHSPRRVDQARQWPRVPGLFVLTALGARGLTLAPLLGELVAAQATGTPWPLEQALADAVDPVRWALRAARAQQAQAQAVSRAGRSPDSATPGLNSPQALSPPNQGHLPDQDAG